MKVLLFLTWKKERGDEKMTLNTTTDIDVGNMCTAENKMDTVVGEKEEMENKMLAENQSQITESEKSNTEEGNILKADDKNEFSKNIDHNKTMETMSENVNLNEKNEDDKNQKW